MRLGETSERRRGAHNYELFRANIYHLKLNRTVLNWSKGLQSIDQGSKAHPLPRCADPRNSWRKATCPSFLKWPKASHVSVALPSPAVSAAPPSHNSRCCISPLESPRETKHQRWSSIDLQRSQCFWSLPNQALCRNSFFSIPCRPGEAT